MGLSADYVNRIAALAKEVEAEDPIDWGMLSIGEDQAYHLIASNTVEMMAAKYDHQDTQDVLLATVVKLLVENFVLNIKLKERLK